MSRHQGFTLIEVVLSLTIGSTIALLGVSMVHKALELRETATDRIRLTHSLDRFGAQFRRDVRSSVEARIVADNELVLSLLDDHEISYRIDDQDLIRIQLHEGQLGNERVVLSSDRAMRHRWCKFDVSDTVAHLQVFSSQREPETLHRLDRVFTASISRWTSESSVKDSFEAEVSEEGIEP